MRIRRWDKRLSRFLDMVDANRVRINKSYQRSGKVWPLNAKSYLVETVIQGLVLPPFMVHSIARRPGARAHDEIVDGQQRTAALLAFRKNEFWLSSAVDRHALRKKKYSTLNAADRRAFDNYQLKINRIEDATEHDVREVFRRINYYTAPLNPEEQRHARFQGEFKWFIQDRREEFEAVFKDAGILTEKRIDRMADAKLLTEIVHAMIHGISTTNAWSLRQIYSDFDREFDLAHDLKRRLSAARTVLASWHRLPKPIAKHYHAYSLLLALLHVQRSVHALSRLVKSRRPLGSSITILDNLNTLASVLELPEDNVPRKFEAFYRASEKGTNVRAARATRFRLYYRALTKTRV
jgi:hypothetical protein